MAKLVAKMHPQSDHEERRLRVAVALLKASSDDDGDAWLSMTAHVGSWGEWQEIAASLAQLCNLLTKHIAQTEGVTAEDVVRELTTALQNRPADAHLPAQRTHIWSYKGP
jgi:hypothetical protein